MSTRHDSTSRWDDTPLRIVSHRLEVTGAAASRSTDNQSSKTGAAGAQTAGGHAVRPSQLRQIVLVDRDIDALRDVAVALRDQFDFHVTISGNEALNLLQSGSIDAIVVGQTLYSSTGLNVLAEARRRAPHTQRILLANAVEATDIERDATQARPFRILSRPCTAQKLVELLDGADDEADAATDPIVTTPPRVAPVPAKPNASIAQSPQTPKFAPPSRRNAPVYHGNYEHVVLETLPDTPRRRSRTRNVSAYSELTINALPIVVYTDNAEFYQSVCAALQDSHDIRLATQLERAVEMAEMGACPILITDRAATQSELQRITIAIRVAEPALITIASGTPNDGLALRKLLNTPALHSFLPKPLSTPLVRLTVEAAKRHYIEAKTPAALPTEEPEPTHETKSPLPIQQPVYRPMQSFDQNLEIEDRFEIRRFAPYAGLAALIVALIAAGGWYWQSRTHKEAETSVLIEAELDLAERAYRAGDYFKPENSNALYFYERVLKRDPQQPTAMQGVDNVVERLVEATEQQITEDHLDAATETAAVLRRLRPEHKRLAFLEGQINKANSYRQAKKLADQSAEVARVEAAKATAAHARLIESRAAGDLSDGLISNASERSQAVARWLTQARQRIGQGKLVAPENDSAEYYYRLAERADPNNLAIDQGLRDIGVRLLADAQDALGRQQIDLARRKIADAARFAPDPAVVARLQRDIESASTASVRNNFLRLTLQRTRENAIFEPNQDSAKYYLSQLQRLDAGGTEVQQATRAIALKLIDNANQATAQRQFNIAIRLLDEVRRLPFSGPELAAADERLQVARAPQPLPPAPIPVSPKVVKAVPAKFPEDAMAARVAGWVDVGFKINADGDVYDVATIRSSPAGQYASKFERAAVAAISQYKFERRPISDSQEQSMVVRVQFKLQQ